MQKLGLDLGSSSIGWALRENDKIEKRGVITFQSGMMKGQTGGYTSPTRDRREARSKRRLIQARKYRKWELLKILLNKFVPLSKNELELWSKYKKGQIQKFPDNENFLKWLACDFTYNESSKKYNNPYELRVEALDNKLSNHEFGRALYHLVQRRGYKDIGETDKETEKQIERRDESGFQAALNTNRTIAEALSKEFLDKGKRARNQYPYREEYRHELEQICKGQGYDVSKNDKGEYIDEFIQQLWKAIIWQRDLRTQKGNIGKCTLEPTKPRCPVSHPIFEIFRAWSFINTIKFYDDNEQKQSLSPDLRNHLFGFFLKKDKNFKFEEIRTFLDKQLKNNKKYNYPINKMGKYDTSVSGMPVCKGLIDVFGDDLKEALSAIHKFNIGNAPKIIHGYSLYDLWHILFAFDPKSSKNKKFLEEFAINTLKVANVSKKEKEYNPFAKIKNNFTTGYSDLSLKAMCKIIPFLKQGYLYNEAVVIAKIPELLGEKWESEKEKIFESVKQSNELYNWNKTIVSITNNLIDQFKGLDHEEKFAYKDFTYTLHNSDINDVEKACQSYYGEKSWKDRIDKNKIIEAVKEQYQTFFKDQKRAYREVPLLTELLKEKLQENKISIDRELYHHSYRKNLYGNPVTDKKTGNQILPEPRIDSIKNPMFNKSMSILRKLINELIINDTIDNDTEIVIELARELNDNNKRAAIERYQNERRNNREKYREFLEEFKEREKPSINIEESISTFEIWTEQTFRETVDEKGKKVTNKNHADILKEKEAVKRYELWMEQKGQCMYTGKMISITQLFSNEIDIEHTIPRSILPDNTLANQTVCYAWYNRDKKKNQFPKQCINYYEDKEGWGTRIEPRLDSWTEKRDNYKKLYEDRIRPKGNEDEAIKNKRIQEKQYYKMHYDYWHDKVERFTAEEVKDSWARRQLVDTQMVSKYAREFLKTYFKKVAVQKGSTTANFRKVYGFQEEDEIKNRHRHTHHAIDAAVLTLIPVNSSHRDRILKTMYEHYENGKGQFTTPPFDGFNSQKLIHDIENNTLVVNYENDKILKQSYRNVRKRGKLQYVKNKKGEFVRDKNGNKIIKKAKGDTVRSVLYKDTFVAKIRDVERYNDGQPMREGQDWKYKRGKDEFIYTVRKPIKDVLSRIDDIVDPIIKEFVKNQRNNAEIKDYQGNAIRHVRIKTSAGQAVKERANYRSSHEYKNQYYSAAGSLPYAILLEKGNPRKKLAKEGSVHEYKTERVMLPIASFDVAKMHKKSGKFDIDQYVKEQYPDYDNWNKKLLKVGQKVIVLSNDEEYERKNEIDFQTSRLYQITQFENNGKRIMLQYHLEARSKAEIDTQIKSIKDSIIKKHEIELDIPLIQENENISDKVERKKDYRRRIEDFASRLKHIREKSSKENSDRIQNEIEKHKTEASVINGNEIPVLLKMSNKNWNFLYEGDDFEISLLGEIKWT
jgi:CRISPR-associated endonuclease Csn1